MTIQFYFKLLGVIFLLAFATLVGFLILLPLRLLFKFDLNWVYGQIFTHPCLWICGLKREVEGLENLKAHQPCIYAGNHQSNFDVVTMGSIYPKRALLIGKKELVWAPFFGQFYAAAGNVLIDRQRRNKAFAGLDKAVKRVIEDGKSIWMYPEGTRNRTEELLQPLKKGAFYMAIKAKVPIVCVLQEPVRNFFDPSKRILRPGAFFLKVLPPLYVNESSDDPIKDLTERTFQQMRQGILELDAKRKAYEKSREASRS